MQTKENSMMVTASNWFVWALLSAVFAALTAIFAKIGLAGVDSDLATLIRTVVIFGALTAFVLYAGKWTDPFELSAKTWLFLVLSGLATGASWVCYFRGVPPRASVVARVDRHSDGRCRCAGAGDQEVAVCQAVTGTRQAFPPG
jgi:transporter family protein